MMIGCEGGAIGTHLMMACPLIHQFGWPARLAAIEKLIGYQQRRRL